MTTFQPAPSPTRNLPKTAYVLVGLVVVVLLAFGIAAFAWTGGESKRDTREQHTIDLVQTAIIKLDTAIHRQGCIAQLQGGVLVAIGEVFRTPPPPAPDRESAAAAVVESADALKAAGKLCR